MSVINKLSNKPIPNNSSFTAASVKNNSMKNISQSFALPESITGPINESFNSAFENSESPFFSATVVIVLGLLILALILIVIFREQIALALELAWRKIKDTFSPPPPPIVVPDVPASPASPAPAPEPTPSAIVEKILPGKKEVFNIVQDKYTYSDAEPLCKAFGAELATYDQVKEAWNKGADWCNYGWVKGQAAVYPTQEETYKKLQAGPESQRGSCGIPGINGGYFDNPELRFGVNCYGSKPAESDADIRMRTADAGSMTQEVIEYDKKVRNFKKERNQIPIAPFAKGSWSS
jgi:hypothetical protein